MPSVRDAEASATPTQIDAPRVGEPAAPLADAAARSAVAPAMTMQELQERHRAARTAGRARRAAQRLKGAQNPTETPAGPTADASTDRRLGTTGETTTRAGQSVAGALARDARYTLREGLSRVTRDKGLKGCGRSAIAGGVAVVMNGGVAHLSGVATCGKIHLCPVCSAKIRAARSDEIDAVTAAWQAAGHGLAMMTLTLRHYRRMPLGTTRKRERGGLVAVQHDAWISAFGMRAGKMWQRLQQEHGIEGYVRVWECTNGENGWHPHFHVLLFTDKPWSEDRRAAFEAAALVRWVRSVEKAGGYRPNDKGVDVTVPREKDARQFSRYLFKNQDGKARFERWAPGTEMTRADLKRGRGDGSRMPFEVGEGAAAGLADGVPLWHEYEYAAHGIRAMYWSNGLRKLLAELVDLDERTDDEIAAEEVGGTGVALIPAETWYGCVIRHRGRSLQLLQAAEAGGRAGVRRLVEKWGLEWGRDVLDPPPPPGN